MICNTLFQTLALVFIVTIQAVSAQVTLTAPIVTDKGIWGAWSSCPEDYFVTSADLATYTMPPAGKHKLDKIGIYSIILKCKHIDHLWETGCEYTRYIKVEMAGTSSTVPCVTPAANDTESGHHRSQDDDCTDGEGTPELETGYRFRENDNANDDAGTTATVPDITYSEPLKISCKDFAVGFSLRSDHAKLSSDSSGANNLRLHCSDMVERTPDYQEGYGVYEGSWTEPQRCPPEYAICGIQAQADDAKPNVIDYIGINSVRMKCCHVPNPALTCTPSDGWEIIAECNNLAGGAETYSCGYSKIVGLGSNSAKDPRDFAKRYFYEGIGYRTLSTGLPFWLTSGLAVNFENNLTSSSTGYDWTASSESNWNIESPVVEHVEVSAAKKTIVSQIVGRCAWFYVRTTSFKIKTTDQDTTPKPTTTTTVSTGSTSTVSGSSSTASVSSSSTNVGTATPTTSTSWYDYHLE